MFAENVPWSCMGLGLVNYCHPFRFCLGSNMVFSTLKTVSVLLIGFSRIVLLLNISVSFHKYYNCFGPMVSNGDDGVLFVRASTRSRSVVVVDSLGVSPVILVCSKEKWDVSDVRLDLFFCLIYYITVIMLHGRPNIPTVNSMGIP